MRLRVHFNLLCKASDIPQRPSTTALRCLYVVFHSLAIRNKQKEKKGEVVCHGRNAKGRKEVAAVIDVSAKTVLCGVGVSVID